MKKLATIAGIAVLGLTAVIATASPSAASPWSHHVQACFDRWGWHYDPHTNLVRVHGHVFRCDLWGPPPPVFWGPPPSPAGPWHLWRPWHPWHR